MRGRSMTKATSGRMGSASVCIAIPLALGALSGCVPIPYKPTATVAHSPIEASALAIRSGARDSVPQSVAKSIERVEARVVLIDATQYLSTVPPGGSGTLSDLLAARRSAAAPPVEATYPLRVGEPIYRQLHDSGAAAPFPYFPVTWVGYEKIQTRSALSASQAADALLVAITTPSSLPAWCTASPPWPAGRPRSSRRSPGRSRTGSPLRIRRVRSALRS